MSESPTPIAEGLLRWSDDEPQLIASRHRGSGVVSFPAASTDAPDVEEILLSRRGTLFTWTTQQFRPPSPPFAGAEGVDEFDPYAVGYVEFPEGILVEGRLMVSDPGLLTIGQQMTVVTVPFGVERSGRTEQAIAFAFAPVAEEG